MCRHLRKLATANGFNDKIPERYIMIEARSEEVITGYGSTSAIPIIDLNKLHDSLSSEECVKLVSVTNRRESELYYRLIEALWAIYTRDPQTLDTRI